MKSESIYHLADDVYRSVFSVRYKRVSPVRNFVVDNSNGISNEVFGHRLCFC